MNRLVKNKVSFVINNYISYLESNSKYAYYINLGKEKLILDNSLLELKNKLLNIACDRNFNKIYNKLIKL